MQQKPVTTSVSIHELSAQHWARTSSIRLGRAGNDGLKTI